MTGGQAWRDLHSRVATAEDRAARIPKLEAKLAAQQAVTDGLLARIEALERGQGRPQKHGPASAVVETGIAAGRFRLSESRLRFLANTVDGIAVRHGGRWRFDLEALGNYLQQRKTRVSRV